MLEEGDIGCGAVRWSGTGIMRVEQSAEGKGARLSQVAVTVEIGEDEESENGDEQRFIIDEAVPRLWTTVILGTHVELMKDD